MVPGIYSRFLFSGSRNTIQARQQKIDGSKRLDLHHEIFVLLLDGELYKAPLDPSKQTRILDIGTGTGVWAFEMACKFPDAEIIATDLSPVARFPWGALANCRFEVDDVEREWLYQDVGFRMKV